MGTRNLTLVKNRRGAIKVAQYGQWDGYPEGQGAVILDFIRSKQNRDMLEEVLNRVSFFSDAAPKSVKDWVEQYNNKAPVWSNQEDRRTETDKYFFTKLISRDIGGEILENLVHIDLKALPVEFDNVIYLQDSSDFIDDDISCEWAYCVNYETEKLEVYKGGKRKVIEFDLESLPDEVSFCQQIENILKKEE